MLQRLEELSWVVALNNSIPVSMALAVAHYVGFFLVVGTAVYVDLRILGVAGRGQGVRQLAEQLFPWWCIGFGFALVSGFIMFAAAADDYWAAGIFRCKVSVVLLAAISSILVHGEARRWGQLPAMPMRARIAAFISIVLWIGAILASVEVPAMSGLG